MAFLGVSAKPGTVERARVRVGDLSDGTPITLPVAMVRGAADGPTLYIQAGLHGDELTGIQIAREALPTLDPKRISGTVVVVPLANVPAHLTRTRGYLHEERWLIDINRIFPGNPHGLLTERIAAVLFNEFVRNADMTIDLHSALDGCDIAPFVYIDPDDDEGGTLALREKVGRAFGTPYVYYKPRGEKLGTSDMTRSMRAQAELAKKPDFSAEMGESRRVSWQHVPLGVRGIHNSLKAMGMEEGAPEVPASQRRFSKITLAHAEKGGGLRMKKHIGNEVRKGDTLAEILDVFGGTIEEVKSPADGFVLREMLLGSLSTGAEVAWIAS